MVSQYQHMSALQSKVKATWFLSLCLLAGIPGLGIGTALWHIIYVLISNNLMNFSLASAGSSRSYSCNMLL